HLYLGAVIQAQACREGLLRIAVPDCRAAYQQAAQGDVEQFYRPLMIPLAEHGGGVEGNALEAPALLAGIGHCCTPDWVFHTIASVGRKTLYGVCVAWQRQRMAGAGSAGQDGGG